MGNENYKAWLGTARKDLREAYRAREILERKIAQLRQTVRTLSALCGEVDRAWIVPKTGGLTEAVKNIIWASLEPISPIDIRNTLEDLGYRFESKNPLAAIHSVVNRLLEREDVTSVRQIKPDGTASRETKVYFGQIPDGWVPTKETKYDARRKAYVALAPEPQAVHDDDIPF